MTQQIYKVSELSEQLSLSIPTIYRMSAVGEFPKPIKLGKRSSGWLKSEVDQWLQDRIEASRNDQL
jgi:prophage regulatory protein